MILQSLVKYYDRLRQDPQVQVSPPGCSVQKISFRVVLESDGKLNHIEDIRQVQNDKKYPVPIIVPGQAKPSGAGMNPCFLWDNTQYMLGYKPEDRKPERTRRAFEAFRKRHLDAQEKIDDQDFDAVCEFLKNWDPDKASDYPVLQEVGNGFGVFRMQGQQRDIHDKPAVYQYALEQNETEANVTGQCLVTGAVAPLARLHEPKIKGVQGAQSSGAAVVSFNVDAFTSYGHEQSYNSPVSKTAAFKYTTALNYLLRRNNPQRVRVGDATVVFWAEQKTSAETIFGHVIDTSRECSDQATQQEVKSALRRIANGRFVEEFGNPETPFYLLGLSPNAARLSVRFWFVSTLGQLCNRLHEHFKDLSLVPMRDSDPQYPAFWQLLAQTGRVSKDIPPLLAGALIRSVLNGTDYPQALYTAVIRRIRADRNINYMRAAILKACLTRKARLNPNYQMKEIPMSLDPERPEEAYQLGRLFAVLEKAQTDALGGSLNATIKDRYFGSASATPASVFPRIIRLNQHHLAKLSEGAKVWYEKLIQEIMSHVSDFPVRLDLNGQGLFSIGYYHQRKALFTKKQEQPTEETE